MAYKIQSSFSAGELDPALHERTTLDKYSNGLKTARNVQIGKTGRLISRPGTKFGTSSYSLNHKSVLYSIPYSQYFIEVSGYDGTNPNIRIFAWGASSPTYTLTDTSISNYNVELIHFASKGIYIFMFLEGIKFKVIGLDGSVATDSDKQYQHPAGVLTSMVSSTSGNYPVEYVMTYEEDGEESIVSNILNIGGYPTVNNTSRMNLKVTATGKVTHMGSIKTRCYRRPSTTTSNPNGSFGFIGYGCFNFVSGSDYNYTFTDFGQEADYEHQPPDYDNTYYVDSTSNGAFNATPKTGTIFQQRLLISGSINKEAIFASRPGNLSNWTRDYPVNAASTLAFKSGSSGQATVLRLMDAASGLIVFTSVGVYASAPGALTPDNLGLDKRGSWVIDEKVPPLEIPGAIIFVDKSTNSVVALNYDLNAASYVGAEVSIFSNHLFYGKTIKSWAYQYGDIPTVWCVMSDGTLNGFTFSAEHKMTAWTHHDTDGLFESVCVIKNRFSNNDDVVFVVKRGSTKNIETLSSRHLTDIKNYVGCDASKTLVSYPSDSDGLTGVYTINPVTLGVWDGELTLTNTMIVFGNSAGNGAVGTIFRYFDADGSAIDLTVTQYISVSSVKVMPSQIWDSTLTTFTGLYKTHNVITGLSHLEGKQVTVFVDGFVEASPLNTVENYTSYTVSGGQITLANGKRGAIITVGLPYAVDIETLDVDTVEQKPTLLESSLASRIFLKIQDSRGIFMANKFPSDDTNTGMVDPEYRTEELDLIGNAAQKPYSRRLEFFIPGDWKSNGRVAIRQVDPLPVEILSIIPDLEVYRR